MKEKQKMIEELFIADNEQERDYRMRCYIYKMAHPEVTWQEVTDMMNSQLSLNLNESTYRKQAKCWINDFDEQLSTPQNAPITDESKGNGYIDDLNTLLREIKKARVQLSDERTQNQAYVRKMAREETLLEMAKEVAVTMSSKKMLSLPEEPLVGTRRDREGILCLSDWHYGIDIDNYFNTYNPRICLNRLCKLRDEVILKGKELKFKKLHVVNMSDLISGRIHLQLRIENRFDAVTQIMQVSEILAEFLTDLSEHFEIEYRDCLDNHSRLEPNKKESMELETLARIIPWYLEERLKDNKRVKILYNTYADDIITFKVFDWEVVAVHGHKDSPSKVITNMIAATRKRNDLVLSAHFHHFSADEENECMRVSNGTLMGVDTHSQDLRLTNKPSQNLIVVNKDNVTEFICKINL
jgi:hypothetical protein